MSKSLLDYAYDYVSKQKNESTFAKIWTYVTKEAGLSEEEAQKKVGQFYTNLTLDGRFVALGGNKWNLRSRLEFNKVHISMDVVYSELNSDNDDIEDKEDENEYNKPFKDDADEDKIESEEAEQNSDDSSEGKVF